MEIRAYGFSIEPTRIVGIDGLITEFEELHRKRKKLDGKFRLFVFSSDKDAGGFFRIGILSVRDEKIVLKLVEENGELELVPTLLEDEHVDFNLVLLRMAKSGALMGIATSYRGAASLNLIEKRFRLADGLALRKEVREIIKASGDKGSAKEYIGQHGLADQFLFEKMMSQSNFEILVGKLDEIQKADLYYDIYQYKEDDPEKLLEREIEVGHKHESIRFKGSRHGQKMADAIKRVFTEKNPKRAKVTGKIQGYEDVIDMIENPDVLWHKDLDEVKKDLKIKLSELTKNPIFDEISRKFMNDPRFL